MTIPSNPCFPSTVNEVVPPAPAEGTTIDQEASAFYECIDCITDGWLGSVLDGVLLGDAVSAVYISPGGGTWSDSFDDVNGTVLSDHTPDSPTAFAWTTTVIGAAQLQIQSNVAAGDTNSNNTRSGVSNITPDYTATVEMTVEVDIAHTTARISLFLGGPSPANFLAFRYFGGAIELKVDPSGLTLDSDTVSTMTGVHTFTVRRDNLGNCSALIDGVPVLTGSDATSYGGCPHFLLRSGTGGVTAAISALSFEVIES